MDFGQLEYNEKEGEPDQTVSFLIEIVFTASRPRDFYTENISSILMTWFTWDSHTVTSTKSLRKPNTGFSFFMPGDFLHRVMCEKGWFIVSLSQSWTGCSSCSDHISNTQLSFWQSFPWHISPLRLMYKMRHGLDSLPVSIWPKCAVVAVYLEWPYLSNFSTCYSIHERICSKIQRIT